MTGDRRPLKGLAVAIGFAIAATTVEAQPTPPRQPQGPLQLTPPLPVPRPNAPAPGPTPPSQVQIRPTQVVVGTGQLNPAQLQTLQRISEVYNGIREMNGLFTQVEGDGTRTTGRFFLTKPGKIRFQYDRPNPLEIVADGRDVVVRDRKANTQDLYPLNQTPLRYLLNDKIDLTRDAKVLGVFKDQDMVSVTIEEKGNFTEGQLTLFFDATTLDLRQWTIIDGRGNETAVAVQNVNTAQRNNPSLFVIDTSQQMPTPH